MIIKIKLRWYIDDTSWVEIYCVFLSSCVICYCWFSSYVMFAVVFMFSNSKFEGSTRFTYINFWALFAFNPVNTDCCWRAFWFVLWGKMPVRELGKYAPTLFHQSKWGNFTNQHPLYWVHLSHNTNQNARQQQSVFTGLNAKSAQKFI